MRLNSMSSTVGTKAARKRVGRGIGSGLGKTCGRGHKGQHARSGAVLQAGFEGGQMPLYRRIPKSGFKSRISTVTQEVRLAELNKLQSEVIDLKALRVANLITANITRVKIILAGSLNKAVTVKGLKVTAGARKAIEQAGGKVEA